MTVPVSPPSFASRQGSLSFDLDLIWNLRHTEPDSRHDGYDALRKAITTSTQAQVQIQLHLSSQPPLAASLTAPIRYQRFLYGTLAFIASPLTAHAKDALQELAMTCGYVLQHLDTLAWLAYYHRSSSHHSLNPPTSRERDILVHLAHGIARAQLPRLLAIEASTIKKHLEHLYRKWEVHTLSETLAVGRSAGLFCYLE